MKLEVCIAGLAIFVQRKVTPGAVTVLLPSKMNHVPRLLVDTALVDLEKSEKPYEILLGPNGASLGVWRITGDVTGGPKSGGNGVGISQQEGCPKANTPPVDDPAWILPLAAVAGCGEVEPACLNGPLNKHDLAARLNLQGGDFTTRSLAVENGQVRMWRLVRDDGTPSTYAQAVAASVCWTLQQSQCVLSKNGSGNIVFKDDAEALLINTEVPLTSTDPNHGAHHFRAYFDYLHKSAAGCSHHPGVIIGDRSCGPRPGPWGGHPAFCTKPIRMFEK
jgi:hypothetical protein